jgi:hypothetical protein
MTGKRVAGLTVVAIGRCRVLLLWFQVMCLADILNLPHLEARGCNLGNIWPKKFSRGRQSHRGRLSRRAMNDMITVIAARSGVPAHNAKTAAHDSTKENEWLKSL